MSVVDSVSFLPSEDPAVTHVLVNEGPDKGVMFKFGRVWFPDETQPILSFDFDIVSEQKPVDPDAFRNFMGEVLQNILLRAIGEQNVVYAGGVDVAEGKLIEPEPTVFDKPPVDSKILTPWNYKLPTPEAGTSMSKNLFNGFN
jgi:hypothetical protein